MADAGVEIRCPPHPPSQPIEVASSKIVVLGPAAISAEKEPSDEDGTQTSAFQFIGVTRTNTLSLRRATAVIAPGFPVTVTIPFALGADTMIRGTTGASSRSWNLCSLSGPIHSLERSVIDSSRLCGTCGVGNGICAALGAFDDVCGAVEVRVRGGIAFGAGVCVGLGAADGVSAAVGVGVGVGGTWLGVAVGSGVDIGAAEGVGIAVSA